jgi:hypothetical protein
MIPGKILQFLDRANVGFAGTRDPNLVPHGHRVSGWAVSKDGRRVTAFISRSWTAHLLESLLDNGQFAMTTEEYPAHEAYQFKGRYVGHRPVTAADIETVDRVRDRFVKALRPFSPPNSDLPLLAFIPEPEVAVEFEVREIFVQTPGPGAGVRIVPPAESAP